jgi:tRNA G37 N-methylase TrmD
MIFVAVFSLNMKCNKNALYARFDRVACQTTCSSVEMGRWVISTGGSVVVVVANATDRLVSYILDVDIITQSTRAGYKPE